MSKFCLKQYITLHTSKMIVSIPKPTDIKPKTKLKMSSKVSSSWSWDSLPSFQDFTAAISNPKGKMRQINKFKCVTNDIYLDMPEVEKVFADMQERLTKLQAG